MICFVMSAVEKSTKIRDFPPLGIHYKINVCLLSDYCVLAYNSFLLHPNPIDFKSERLRFFISNQKSHFCQLLPRKIRHIQLHTSKSRIHTGQRNFDNFPFARSLEIVNVGMSIIAVCLYSELVFFTVSFQSDFTSVVITDGFWRTSVSNG